jgi:hypothetical protein
MKKMNRKVAISIVAILALSLITFVVAASDDEDKDWKGYFLVGGAYVDAENFETPNSLSSGRIAEYGFAESVPVLGFGLGNIAGDGYTFVDAEFYTVDQMNASLAAKFGGLTVNGKFSRFLHRLNNDPFLDFDGDNANYTGLQTFTLHNDTMDDEMMMRATILEGGLKFAPETFKGGSLFLHSRLIGREGDKQTSVLGYHCSNCHMEIETTGFEMSQLETVLGAEMAKKGFAARYEYTMANMDNATDTFDIMATATAWALGAPGDVVTTNAGYDNKKSSNAGMVRFDMNNIASVYGKFKIGEVENKNTGNKHDLTYYTGKVNVFAGKMLRLKAMFDHSGSMSAYSVDSHAIATVPGLTLATYSWNDGHGFSTDTINGFGFERTRLSGTALVRLNKAMRFEGSYMTSTTERTGVHSAEETKVNTFKLKGSFRPNKMFRVRAYFSMLDRENPIGHLVKDHGTQLDGLYHAYNGTEETAFGFNALVTPNDKTVFTLNYVYKKEEGSQPVNASLNTFAPSGSAIINPLTMTATHFITDITSLDMTKTTMNFNATGSFQFNDKSGAYASYSMFNNTWDSELYMGTRIGGYRGWWFSNQHTNMDYEGKGNVISASAWLSLGKVTLTPGWNYTTVESGFADTPEITLQNNMNTVDITINQFSLKASMPINDKLFANVGFYYDDYADAEIVMADATMTTVYGYLKWKF